MKINREYEIRVAKLAEKTERYEDMAMAMKLAVKADPILSLEERNLLSVAYKNVLGSLRSAYRATERYEKEENQSACQKRAAAKYKQKLIEEIKCLCEEVLVSK